jgi:hypothetical protein
MRELAEEAREPRELLENSGNLLSFMGLEWGVGGICGTMGGGESWVCGPYHSPFSPKIGFRFENPTWKMANRANSF